MPETEILYTFVIASALLSLAPGPDNIFVLSLSALYGKRPALWIILGLCTGLLLHSTLVALGVALLIKTYPVTFTVLKLAGASYLLLLAWQLWNEADQDLESGSITRLSARALYRRGIIMNITNPKVSLFFLAYLPQFVSNQAGVASMQVFVLGGIFILIAFVIFNLIALFASILGDLLRRSSRIQLYLHRITSVILVALAFHLLLTTTGV